MHISLGVASKAPCRILGEYGGGIRFEVETSKEKKKVKGLERWLSE